VTIDVTITAFTPDDPAIVEHFVEHGWALTDDLDSGEVAEL
jgi:hypothetical protein